MCFRHWDRCSCTDTFQQSPSWCPLWPVIIMTFSSRLRTCSATVCVPPRHSLALSSSLFAVQDGFRSEAGVIQRPRVRVLGRSNGRQRHRCCWCVFPNHFVCILFFYRFLRRVLQRNVVRADLRPHHALHVVAHICPWLSCGLFVVSVPGERPPARSFSSQASACHTALLP